MGPSRQQPEWRLNSVIRRHLAISEPRFWSVVISQVPQDGHREESIRMKAFEDYIRDNVVSWFNWSKSHKLQVDVMEELILITGCTVVDSWAASTVAFVGHSELAEISPLAQTPDRSDRSFEVGDFEGVVTQHCIYFDSVHFPRSLHSP